MQPGTKLPDSRKKDTLREKLHTANNVIKQLEHENKRLNKHREDLWRMLDNISTFGDAFKPQQTAYFKAVNRECEMRGLILVSYDGQSLVEPSNKPTTKPQEAKGSSKCQN